MPHPVQHKRIVRREPQVDPAELPDSLPAVLRRVYAARGIRRPEELEHVLNRLHRPEQLGGLATAVDLLEQALVNDRRILIVGDFDADGATSSALCVRALRALGARQVDFLVPNRFEYGYGLTPEIVGVALERRPDLIMTVDNGVSSHQGVAAAQAAGVQVLVTDHHLPGAVLPPAEAIVNPNLPNDPFPSKHLAGVGVAFYVMSALRARLRETGWFAQRGIDEPNLAGLLDLVALGTVADVVPLDHNNRILVEQGLRRIRAGQCVPGITALLQAAGRDPGRCVASDLGFAVGPRLNAAGRMEDMRIGIDCLLADSMAEARRLAATLDGLNRERREVETQMKEEALRELETLHLDAAAELPVGVCLYNPDWHQGVIGILAARVKETWHRPVIAFARAGGDELKGSARSVPGLHIRDVLDAVAARHPELIRKFGGHAMAAGLSLAESALADFKAAFDAEVRRHLDEQALQGIVYSDGELAPDELSLETAELLRAAGPWGQAFPEPVFDGDFELVGQRVVGERHLKLQLREPRSGRNLDAIAFHAAAQHVLEPGAGLRLAYRADSNAFRGQCSLQLVVEYIETL
ncbi:MAG: single-stranded-DNA-specific exonuclease RecJ [Gammaproteobacteria bacterium]|nr:single-stranded-DNA-specific exonuclease RecJ [Gammaproteobacteria bacterium]